MSSSESTVSSEEIDVEALRKAPAFLSESSDENAEAQAQDNQNGAENSTPEARPIPVLNRPTPMELDLPTLSDSTEQEQRSEDTGVTLYLTPLNPDGSYNYDDDESYTPPTTPTERRFNPRLPPFPDPDFNIFRNARPIRPSLNFRPRVPGLSNISFPTPTDTPRSEDVLLMQTPLNPDGTPRSSDEDYSTPRPRSPASAISAPGGDRARPVYPALLRAREFIRSTRANVLNYRSPYVPGHAYFDYPLPRIPLDTPRFNFASPTQNAIITPRLPSPSTGIRAFNIAPGSRLYRNPTYSLRRASGTRMRAGRMRPRNLRNYFDENY